MIVRLLTGLVTASQAYAPGDLYPCDADTARRLIESGQALAVEPAGPIAAVRESVERAIRPRAKGRG